MTGEPRIPKAELTGIYGALVTRMARRMLGDVPDGLTSVCVVCIASWLGGDLDPDDNVVIETIDVLAASNGNDSLQPQARPPLPADEAAADGCGACGPGTGAGGMISLLGLALVRRASRREAA